MRFGALLVVLVIAARGATHCDYYAFGNSNTVLGGGTNWMYYLLNQIGSPGVKVNGGVSGQTSSDGKNRIDQVLTDYTIDTAIIMMWGTNDAGHGCDSAYPLDTIYGRVRSNYNYIRSACVTAGKRLDVIGPLPAYYDGTRPGFFNAVKQISSTVYEWCVVNQIRYQDPYLTMVMRDSTIHADYFNTTYRAAADKYHLRDTMGIATLGRMVARARVPTRTQAWGRPDYDSAGSHSWASCWLTGASVDGNADTGDVLMGAGNVCLGPVRGYGYPDSATRIIVNVSNTGSSVVWIRSWPNNIAVDDSTTGSEWIRTSTLYAWKRVFVQWKLVASGVDTVHHVTVAYNRQSTPYKIWGSP